MRLVIPLMGLFVAAIAEEIDPKIYVRLFMNNKPLFDRMAQAVVKKLPSGGKILDLGSGPGEPTVTLATMASGCRIVCTDVQPAMNEKAKSRVKAAGLVNVDFAVTSADDLSTWNLGEFDAVMMSFVLMFVPDTAKSLREVARVLKPGGMAYTAVWKNLTFQDLTNKAMQEVVGSRAGEWKFAIDPMKLSADNAVESLATAAGLEIIGEERFSYAFKMGTSKEAADGALVLAGGMLKQLEANGDTGATARFYTIIDRMIQEHGWSNAGEVSIPDNWPQMLMLRKPLKDEL